MSVERAFRPCDTCGGCPIWWQPHGGCQADVERHKDSCDAAQCNRTVRAIGASFSSTGDFKTTDWGPNEVVQRNPEGPERQFYSQISFPFCTCSRSVSVFRDTSKEAAAQTTSTWAS